MNDNSSFLLNEQTVQQSQSNLLLYDDYCHSIICIHVRIGGGSLICNQNNKQYAIIFLQCGAWSRMSGVWSRYSCIGG